MATQPSQQQQQQQQQNARRRPMCIYGAMCGRSDHLHWQRFDHPDATDTPRISFGTYSMPLRALGINAFTEQPDGTLKMTYEEKRPKCICGALCNRAHIKHWLEFYHPLP